MRRSVQTLLRLFCSATLQDQASICRNPSKGAGAGICTITTTATESGNGKQLEAASCRGLPLCRFSDSGRNVLMDLKSLRYFVEIARQKSFTAAAEKLFVTQPTLSRQIADLEDELGHKLFDRSTRRIELTEKGIYLFRQAQAILSLVEKTKLEAMSSQDLAGDLTISAGETPAMEIVAQATERFRASHPLVRFHLLSSSAQTTAESLRMGIANFGVFNQPADLEGFEYVTLPQQNRWGVLTRRDGPLAGRTSVSPKDLENLPLYFSKQQLIRSRMAGWLNYPFERLNIVGSYNLLYNASLIVRAGGNAICINGITRPDDEIAFLPFVPAFKTDVVFAWPAAAPKRILTEEFLKTLRTLISDERRTSGTSD